MPYFGHIQKVDISEQDRGKVFANDVPRREQTERAHLDSPQQRRLYQNDKNVEIQ